MSSFTADDRAIWTLRSAVALTCIAVGAQLLMYGGPVFSWLWLNLGWSEQAALRVEHAGAFALIVCAPLVMWDKAWAAAGVACAWLVLTTIAHTAVETWHPWLTPGALAARWVAPLALMFWTLKRPRHAEWLLRASIASTFAFHGIEALLANPLFIDYIISGGSKIAGARVQEASAVNILLVIGVADLLVAIGILLPQRIRAVAAWMATWGFLTAAARVLYMGWGNWPEALIRVTNGAVPLTLLLLWGSTVAPKDKHEATE